MRVAFLLLIAASSPATAYFCHLPACPQRAETVRARPAFASPTMSMRATHDLISGSTVEPAPSRSRTVHLMLRGGFSIGHFLTAVSNAADALPALFILSISIMLEVLATTCMKLASTKSPAWFSGVFVGYFLCFSIFPLALRRLPLSIAYATWSGVGTAASVVIGAAYFGEKITLLKLLWIACIVAGVAGLNL